jgi:phosphopantetheine adenylyltransferase
MRSFKDINEARGDNTAVFTFGRFNPPTTGHGKLLDALAKQAKKNGAPYYVFASHSENAKKDPLPYVKKVAYMKKMFPKHARSIFVDKARQVFEVAVSLYNKGHKSVVMVVGSDRVTEFDGLLKKYNKLEGKHGYYEFENIQVISAGERDPDSEGVSGMSASKMIAGATSDDYDSFKNGVP